MRSLEAISKNLSEEVRCLSREEKRERCLLVCQLAIDRVGLDHSIVKAGMDFLRRGMYGESRVISDLQELVDELDREYFQALDRYKAGREDEATYRLLFERARVVNAVLFALHPDESEAINEAIYEAGCAIDDEEIAAFLKSMRLHGRK